MVRSDQIRRNQMSEIKIGDQVRIHHSTDGHQGVVGAVIKVFDSGRCLVFVNQLNILNLTQSQIEKCDS